MTKREIWLKMDAARDLYKKEERAAKACKPCSAEYHRHMKAAKAARKEYAKLEKEEEQAIL